MILSQIASKSKCLRFPQPRGGSSLEKDVVFSLLVSTTSIFKDKNEIFYKFLFVISSPQGDYEERRASITLHVENFFCNTDVRIYSQKRRNKICFDI